MERTKHKCSISGGAILRQFLEINQISYVFGNPGTTETTFLSALSGSKTEYILSLHESSATGIAAGYALITKKPAVVNIHTFPGLANALFNMKNAYDSGIGLLVIAGQQDTRFLIHNPVLAASNTELAKTTTKYAYEVARIDDLHIALQRCYVQATLEPKKPVFLSIPMNIMNLETHQEISFRHTKIIDDCVPESLQDVLTALMNVPTGKLVIIADYAVGACGAIDELSLLAQHLHGDIYSAAFHVEGVVNPQSPNYRGQLPVTTAEIRHILSQYDTLLLLGEKIDTFLYTGEQALPPTLKMIHISPVANQLGFDYPVDIAVCGHLKATLRTILTALGAQLTLHTPLTKPSTDLKALQNMYAASDRDPTDQVLLELLQQLDRTLHLVTEGSAEDSIVQDIAIKLNFMNVHFSPRGGGLGWAMPLAVGIALATSSHAICFVGDGGSLFSIHSIWTAAKHKIPVIFICFINHEYRILKDLWCIEKNIAFDQANFIGLDFNNPEVNIASIASGFGARIDECNHSKDVSDCLKNDFAHQGPTFILINRR